MACAEVGAAPVGSLCVRGVCYEDQSPVLNYQDLFPLPPEFVSFLLQQNVDPRVYCAAQALPRYIRAKPSAGNVVEEAQKEIGTRIEPVSWLPGFYKCSSQALISSSALYKSGKIYGMDAASGAAVAALGIKSGDHVLDVCAAPGAKLCMIAELLGQNGTLTGVDISRPRLAACRTMLQKYDLGSRTRLFLADGTIFSILPVTNTKVSATEAPMKHQSRNALSYLLKEGRLTEWRPPSSKREKRVEQSNQDKTLELFFYGKDSGIVGMSISDILITGSAEFAYDKVLVDAECTHDGSLKHICKFEQWGWETFEKRFFNQERISSITQLQLKLLSNGFKLLKQGGSLVYSTCSFTYDQNEGVVKQFLSMHANAELREVEAAKFWPCKYSDVQHCLRFDPLVSNTNGQFIAKIVKV